MKSRDQRFYDFPIARDYVARWGTPEAIREIIQNALDSDSPFEYKFVEHQPTSNPPYFDLHIISKNSQLDASTLLLGTTSKAGGTKIGSFGEGYKIALLVLARTNTEVIVHNADVDWTPSFVFKKQYNAELFRITETSASVPQMGLTFIVKNLDHDMARKVIDSCLHMQWGADTADITERLSTDQGEILIGRKGKLYVGGLFVCETDLDHSYDIKPQYLRLERDRQTVSSFDLGMVAKNMWFAAGRPEMVAEMIANGVPEMQYASWSTLQRVAEACYNHFTENNPGQVAVDNQTDFEHMQDQGLKPKLVSTNYLQNIQESQSYQDEKHYQRPPKKSPYERLKTFFDYWIDNMPDAMAEGMQEILDESENW